MFLQEGENDVRLSVDLLTVTLKEGEPPLRYVHVCTHPN